MKKKKNRLYLAVFLALVLLDQGIKFLIRRLMPLNSSLMIINDFFSLTYVRNTGISFGMLKGFNLLFIFITLIVFGFFIYLMKKNKEYRLQLSIISAGVVGNLIDRVFLGYVVDFIHFSFFAIFNIADSCVTIGMIWLIIASIKDKKDLF